MKKIIIVSLAAVLFMLMLPVAASANFPPGITCSSPGANAYPVYYTTCLTGNSYGWTPPSGGVNFVNAMYYYVPFKDEYRVDYNPPSGVSWYQLHFTAANNDVFTGDYFFPPTGTHWLTCNGTYKLKFYDAADNLISETQDMITTEIVNPSCLSYADGINGNDDLGADYTDNEDGTYDINWSPMAGADSYEVWQNGQLVDTTTGTTSTVTGKGSVSIVAKDANGDIIGQSDLTAPDLAADYAANAPQGCNICEKIAEALNCPEWDTYMGELTGAIRDALPTLPEWRSIAEQFVDAFDDYLGDPPAVPNPTNITPEIPAINTSVPDAAFNLVVPSDFNDPITFDITTGPAIPVVDESEPFVIEEPDANIESDSPGVMVYPGDERNHSDGIKQPDTITTPYPTPIPETQPPPEDPPEIPPSEIPIPSSTTGTTPEPGGTGGGDMAFPTIPEEGG